ncbi:MAG: DUF1653 domain-containing protein [Lachnospiraceae bacterium]|nr:DUF1653 domain-containing protein [Lachnospiraceae bacterium]
MTQVRIVSKHDEASPEYEVGGIYTQEGTWYGGCYITGRSGISVPLDKDEYVVCDDTPAAEDRDLRPGDIVRHFKRETVTDGSNRWLYQILAFARHTETGEKLVVYQALYAPFDIFARPYDMFMSRVDQNKYPSIRQVYRFEKENI